MVVMLELSASPFPGRRGLSQDQEMMMMMIIIIIIIIITKATFSLLHYSVQLRHYLGVIFIKASFVNLAKIFV